MEIWIRVIADDGIDITKGKEYRVLGFDEGEPIILDDVNEFQTLYDGYIVTDTGSRTKRDVEL